MNDLRAPDPADGTGCSTPRALCGWSPPPTAADTPLKRAADKFMPRTGISVLIYFGAVVGLMAAAPAVSKRGELAVDAVTALAGAMWCGLNFWRCGHAHCLVAAAGWSALAVFDFIEAGMGRSLIHGDEQLVFLGVLALGLLFEGGWYRARGSNAVTRSGDHARVTRPAR